MRSRKKSNADSLDMLLDTITNTFGGIVFLAILLVVLTGSSKPEKQAAPDPFEVEQITQRINDLRGQQSVLSQTKTAQKILTSVSGLLSTHPNYESAKKNAHAYAESRSQLSSTVNAKFTVAARTVGLAEKIKQLTMELLEAKRQADDVSAKLEQEIEKRKKNVVLPKEKATNRKQTVVFVRHEKMFLLDESMGSSDFRIYANDFQACPPSQAIVGLATGHFQLREKGGVRLDDDKQIAAFVSRFDASKVFVTVAIWGDSFELFAPVQDLFGKVGLEYQLILMKPDGKISESPRQGSPKVQ